MIAVVTKWQKHAPDSIAWPNTLSFMSAYSETNLPLGFTPTEYFAFLAYAENFIKTAPVINIVINNNVEDTEGNVINSRVFVDDEGFNTYKMLSDASEAERNTLLSMFKLTRVVKIFNDHDQIIDIIDKSTSYDEINSFFAV